jgi:hypothetical protein
MGQLIKNTTDSGVTSVDSGATNLDVHIFVDNSGNVVQIKKVIKSRLKFYIDPVLPPDDFSVCAIGVSDAFGEDCTDGIALGLNNDDLMANANYL